MTRLLRHVPRALVSSVVALLLIVFIGVPIGAVLVESFVISGPMPPVRLKSVTVDALGRLPEEERAALIRRWVETATEAERVEATATAFQLAGLILLVAMIGAIVLTLRVRQDVKRQDPLAQMFRDPAKTLELRDPEPGQGLAAIFERVSA